MLLTRSFYIMTIDEHYRLSQRSSNVLGPIRALEPWTFKQGFSLVIGLTDLGPHWPAVLEPRIGFQGLGSTSCSGPWAPEQRMCSIKSPKGVLVSLANTTCEITGFLILLKDPGVVHHGQLSSFWKSSCSTQIFFFSNQVALHITANPIHHKRTQHIKIDCHTERKVQAGIWLFHVFTQNQIADILSKAWFTVQCSFEQDGNIQLVHPIFRGRVRISI